jgi:hypothetical protein
VPKLTETFDLVVQSSAIWSSDQIPGKWITKCAIHKRKKNSKGLFLIVQFRVNRREGDVAPIFAKIPRENGSFFENSFGRGVLCSCDTPFPSSCVQLWVQQIRKHLLVIKYWTLRFSLLWKRWEIKSVLPKVEGFVDESSWI